MRFTKTFLQAACLFLALMVESVALEPPAFAADPDPSANPVLANYLKLGAKLYYLGSRSGLDGWFVIMNGQMQVAYATSDAQSMIVGTMWDAAGENVTNSQAKILFNTNKDVVAALSGAGQKPASIIAAPMPPEAIQAARYVGQYDAASTAISSAASSTGEKLMADLQNMAGVTLGAASAPKLMMVMDPNCPHCQATWKDVRALVMKNALQVRLIPVTTPGSDNERAAAQLLHSADPLSAWDKYVSGDKSQLAGTPEPNQIIALRANHMITDAWHINTTPYLTYRGKDGKIKIVQGEPEKIETILDDLKP
jgi:thiol:disulfide interchange protein DsbG